MGLRQSWQCLDNATTLSPCSNTLWYLFWFVSLVGSLQILDCMWHSYPNTASISPKWDISWIQLVGEKSPFLSTTLHFFFLLPLHNDSYLQFPYNTYLSYLVMSMHDVPFFHMHNICHFIGHEYDMWTLFSHPFSLLLAEQKQLLHAVVSYYKMSFSILLTPCSSPLDNWIHICIKKMLIVQNFLQSLVALVIAKMDRHCIFHIILQ